MIQFKKTKRNRGTRTVPKELSNPPIKHESDGCMKFYYDNREDYETLNLPCKPRPWESVSGKTGLETFNDIDTYAPGDMNNYINKHYSNENPQFSGNSPFEYTEDYGKKTVDEICDRSNFSLRPQQKFGGMFINNYTDFQGALVYNNLGSGKTALSIVIAEALKSQAISDNGQLVSIPNRSPFRVIVVVPKNIQEPYYEEIIGKIRDNTIQSVPAACVILQGRRGVPVRQVYVGNLNKSSGKYSVYELSQLDDIKVELDSLGNRLTQTSDIEMRKSIRGEMRYLNNRLIEITKKIKSKINSVYYIVSHDSFLNNVMKTVKDGNTYTSEATDYLLTEEIFHSPNSLIIIDEIQKMVREFSEDKGSNYRRLYYTLMFYARQYKNGLPAMKVVLMTATPVYDNPHEAALMINLLRPRIPFPVTKKEFNNLFISKDDSTGINIKNKLLFKYMCSGYVLYFKGGNPSGYPARTNYIKLHRMRSEQEKEYSNILVEEIKSDSRKRMFSLDKDQGTGGQFNISIQKCNIVYPRVTNSRDIKNHLEDVTHFSKKLNSKKTEDAVFRYASDYSNKFVQIINIIKNSKGPVYIYTKWVLHGILGLVSIFNALGWNFLNPDSPYSNAPQYTVWSPGGLENISYIHGLKTKGVAPSNQLVYINKMRKIFNSSENHDGRLCKVLIGNVVEGISLKNVSQVHICEPWWNESKMEQIIARAIRLCSHIDNPVRDQKVDVYYHSSVLSTYPRYNPIIQHDLEEENVYKNFQDLSRSTIEQKMYITSQRKNRINIQFDLSIKESAVDCNLNKYGNIVRLEECVFPGNNFRQDNIYGGVFYNRTVDLYYVIKRDEDGYINLYGIDLVHEDVVSGTSKLVYNWPATDYVFNNKNITDLEDWQITEEYGRINIVLYEDIKCDISNLKIKNLPFMDLYKYAIQKGEEPSAWKYCFDMFRKNELLPKLITDYNVLDGGTGGKLSNCLYKSLVNIHKNNLFSGNSLEKKINIRNLEKFIIKPVALRKNTQLYKDFIIQNTSLSNNTVENFTYPQLEQLMIQLKNKESKSKPNHKPNRKRSKYKKTREPKLRRSKERSRRSKRIKLFKIDKNMSRECKQIQKQFIKINKLMNKDEITNVTFLIRFQEPYNSSLKPFTLVQYPYSGQQFYHHYGTVRVVLDKFLKVYDGTKGYVVYGNMLNLIKDNIMKLLTVYPTRVLLIPNLSIVKSSSKNIMVWPVDNKRITIGVPDQTMTVRESNSNIGLIVTPIKN
jgi:hypothetical protein